MHKLKISLMAVIFFPVYIWEAGGLPSIFLLGPIVFPVGIAIYENGFRVRERTLEVYGFPDWWSWIAIGGLVTVVGAVMSAVMFGAILFGLYGFVKTMIRGEYLSIVGNAVKHVEAHKKQRISHRARSGEHVIARELLAKWKRGRILWVSMTTVVLSLILLWLSSPPPGQRVSEFIAAVFLVVFILLILLLIWDLLHSN